MKKSIGIVTCHTPLNYGAMLQAYGLQIYLKSIGCHAEIINYAPDIYFEEIRLSYVGDPAYKKNWGLRIIYILYKLAPRIKRNKNFNQFKRKFLAINSHRYKSFEELAENCPVYDHYICGSDQIWNTLGLRGWNPTFYLQFVPDRRKRHSYAASMSIQEPISEKLKDTVFPMMEELNGIAVREELTVHQIRPYIKQKVYNTLDPVYLLSRHQWDLIADEAADEHKRFILIYPMEKANKVIENARRLSESTGLPIYCISASLRKTEGVTKYFDCSIPKFLNLIREAEYVITNSFHGTSLSIIFRKDFWSCQVQNNNHRITEILKKFDLLSRYISDEDYIDTDSLKIDYSQPEISIDREIRKSKEYIDYILK